MATRSVEVTFYRSSTPTVWCYLAERLPRVECIDDPCEGFRASAERLGRELEEAREEIARLKRQLRRLSN